MGDPNNFWTPRCQAAGADGQDSGKRSRRSGYPSMPRGSGWRTGRIEPGSGANFEQWCYADRSGAPAPGGGQADLKPMNGRGIGGYSRTRSRYDRFRRSCRLSGASKEVRPARRQGSSPQLIGQNQNGIRRGCSTREASTNSGIDPIADTERDPMTSGRRLHSVFRRRLAIACLSAALAAPRRKQRVWLSALPAAVR